MKVKELIEKLYQMDQEAIVLCPGYEDGYDDVANEPVEALVVCNLKARWYNGTYDIAVDSPHEYDKEHYDYSNPIKAVII